MLGSCCGQLLHMINFQANIDNLSKAQAGLSELIFRIVFFTFIAVFL
jgi:hypothetical protein